MFDIGIFEVFILVVVALIVVGPKDLPKLLRTVVGYVRKIRKMGSEFQSSIKQIADDVEYETIIQDMNKASQIDIDDPISKKAMEVDPVSKPAPVASEVIMPASKQGTKPAPKKYTAKKKAAAKKAIPKKSPVKKTTVKKAVPKKGAPKKSVVKKTAVKKKAVSSNKTPTSKKTTVKSPRKAAPKK